MSQNLPAVIPINELERMAQAFAKSGMFGAKTPEQALALLLLAQGEGLHPAIAMRDFDVIQGRPAKKAEAMLRSFIGAGGKVEWHQLDDTCADATFSHPQGGTARISWDMKRAKIAGVGNKDMYNKYPRQMLRSRVVSEGCRTVYPASTSGMYVPEEVVQFGREKDITPVAGALQALPSKERDIVTETADQVLAYLANDQLTDAYSLWQDSNFDADHEVAFWSCIPDSKARAALKEMQAREGAKDKGLISPAKHKRIEALIKELKLDREAVKAFCKTEYGVEHLNALTDKNYSDLDGVIAGGNPSFVKATAPVQETPSAPSVAAPESGATINEAQESAILDLLELHGVTIAAFLKQANIKKILELQSSRFDGATKWIKTHPVK